MFFRSNPFATYHSNMYRRHAASRDKGGEVSTRNFKGNDEIVIRRDGAPDRAIHMTYSDGQLEMPK